MIKDVGGKERGPLLASLDLEKQLAAEIEAEMDTAKTGESSPPSFFSYLWAVSADYALLPLALPSLVRAYFETFSTKPCCFEDVKPFLSLDVSAVDEFRRWLTAVLEKKPVSRRPLYRRVFFPR